MVSTIHWISIPQIPCGILLSGHEVVQFVQTRVRLVTSHSMKGMLKLGELQFQWNGCLTFFIGNSDIEMLLSLQNLLYSVLKRSKEKTMEMSTTKLLLLFMKLGVYIFCTWLFISLMSDVWFKYSSKITTNGMRFRLDNATARPLHCFTVHEFSAFKVRGFYYTDKMIKENSFTLEEIFGDTSLRMLANASSMLTVREHYSIFFGTCFTICMDMPLTSR